MKNEDDKIIIPLSKRKIILLTIVAFIFTAAPLWILIDTDSEQIKLAMIVGVLFFGICGIYALVKLFDKNPGLIITPDGLIDNASGLIKWEDITELEILNMQYNIRFLLIFVKNPEFYLNKMSVPKKIFAQLNYKKYGTPLSISSLALQCNFDKLVEIINSYTPSSLNAGWE